MEITLLHIISIVLIFIFFIGLTFSLTKKNITYKYTSTTHLLDIFDQINLPLILLGERDTLEFNQAALKLKALINDISQLQNQSCIQLGETYYQISRFRTSSAPSKELIVFGYNHHTHDTQILQFLTFSAIAGAILDPELGIISSNPIINQLIPLEEQKISNMLEIINAEDHKRLRDMLGEHDQGRVAELQEFNISKYEKVVLVYINSILLHNKKHFICKLFDITHYKALETKLAHAQRMQAVGELSGAIAHDFNNLLTAIIGFSELLLLEHSPDEKSFDDIMQIKQNANRAANLVRQLLAFSSQQVLLPKVLDLGKITSELSSLLTTLIGQNITLTIEHDTNLALVKADQGQLEQVIINLAVNARDAMSGTGKLLIKTSNILVGSKFKEKSYIAPKGDDPIPAGNYVLIEVEDTGSGIPKDILEKIFEPFFSTKGPTYGTGLGLATVYGIVKQTGGYVRLQTKLNQGTKFLIFLTPTDEPETTDEHPVQFKKELMEKLLIKDHNYKGKILIVEDEISVRLFGTYALENKEYDVIAAENAEVALEIIESEGNAIDLIITDVMMPGMTGPEMVEKIAPKYPHIKFIFTSGYAEDAVSYLSSGGHHFLPKPFSINELATKVKEVISGE